MRVRQLPRLFLRFLGFFGLLNHERFNPRKLLLESARKVRRPVFEKNDEAKSEEHEKGKPKQPAQQNHGQDVTARKMLGQRRVESESDILPDSGGRLPSLAIVAVSHLPKAQRHSLRQAGSTSQLVLRRLCNRVSYPEFLGEAQSHPMW